MSVTVFAEMSALAARTGAVNLGQGFPDADAPAELREAARRAISEGLNQYPPGRGMPDLREAISEHQQRFWQIPLDPEREVLVTAGATEALAAALLALVEPGDEVLTVEPFYDAYAAGIALARGVHTSVVLRREADRFVLDHDALRAAVTSRTKVILLNNPNNPTGHQYGREDLALLVELAARVGATIVTDEVYEHLCFDAPHIPVASLRGAFERTLTISSAGKTFNMTGWKIGWLSGPAELVEKVLAVKQWLTFASGTPFQPAVALGLRMGDEFFAGIRDDLRERRDLLGAGLRAAGFEVFTPSAGYFTVVDAAPLGVTDAAQAARAMAGAEPPFGVGVVGIPFSGFTHPSSTLGRSWIRFAQCKDRVVIERAVSRLAELRRGWGHPDPGGRPDGG